MYIFKYPMWLLHSQVKQKGPASLKAKHENSYLIQPSKEPGLKGMPWPMSPRSRSPCASRSKAASTSEKNEGNKTICISCSIFMSVVRCSAKYNILTQHGGADVNAHPKVSLIREIISTQPSTTAGKYNQTGTQQCDSKNAPRPGQSAWAPGSHPISNR